MRRRARWLVAFAVGAALAVLAIAIAALRQPRDERGAAPTQSQASVSTPQPNETTPIPVESGDGRDGLEASADPKGRGKQPRPRANWAEVWLVGSVRASSVAPAELTLLVRPGPNDRSQRGATATRSAWGKPSADGSFRIDVSVAFPKGADDLPTVLTLQAVRDGTLPTEIEVPVPFGAEALARGGTLEIPASIELRETCRLEGTAWVIGDEAATIEVAAFALVDGVPALQPAATSSGHTARIPFELALDCDRDYAVLAYLDGYRPTTRIVHANSFGILELPLERGAPLSGSARLGQRPLEATVVAQIEGASDPQQAPSVNGTSFAWVAGAFEWGTVSARTREEGRFELHGVAPAAYELRLAGVTGVYSKDAARLRVTPPAEGLVLSPEVCEIVVELVSAGSPAANALLSIQETSAEGSVRLGSTRTDAEGRATIWAAPGASVKVTAAKEHVLTCGDKGSSEVVRLVE